ncbi:MAG TPA: DUF6454 family protein [Pirellulales bacterium]|jgi:hypothetical protein
MNPRLHVILAILISLSSARPTMADDPPKVTELPLIAKQSLSFASQHVQGLAVSAEHYWISSVDRGAKRGLVFRVERSTGNVTAQRELSFGAQFHPGGIDVVDGALWVPVAEYRPRSSTTIAKLDPTTLETLASFTIDDHIGCLTVVAPDEIVAANWDARTFYRLSLIGKRLGESANPRAAAYQDLKTDGDLILASGTEKRPGMSPVPVVDRLNATTLALVSRWQPQGTLQTGGSNFCREGCALFRGEIYLMPEDGPHTTIYRFAKPRD